MALRVCKYCDEEFVPGFRHPGLVNVCLDSECQRKLRADGVHEPQPITANVAWEGKHTPVIQLVYNTQESARFNGSQRRFGFSVMQSMTSGGTIPLVGKHTGEAGYEKGVKGLSEGTSKGYADPGSLYWSKVGECRSVKR